MSTAIAADPFASLRSGGSTTTTPADDAASADRFLKLLVTQMQNQDPLNPMDNAQITSQMAQINTVAGLQTLNTSVQGLGAQFMQMQALQGAALVGHEVTLQGSRMVVNTETGLGVAGFELGAPADAVKVEVLNAAGRVVDTLNLGALDGGRHDILWDARQADPALEYRFRISATSGAQAVAVTPLMRDQVQAVSTSGGGLVLRTLFSGDVAYGDVKAFN
ncbi:MAG: flagellar hook capping FlgD N-terminal domain-containing protein [Rubrivivax sp.]|nr:flagellar hook capping FlgD N-terminal domain-containing protein [Rubrivivax sp.]